MKRKFGLIGKCLGHSFSKSYFEQKFNENRVDAQYLNYELSEIDELIPILNKEDLSGLNVTIPYKESIIPYLNELSEVAADVGAVNTVRFSDGKLIGHNTDVYGFKQMIKPFFKSRHERAVILGTGGASKAIAYVLEGLGCEVIYISRNPQREDEFTYEEMNENMMTFCKIIVNCTPLGTFPEIEQCPNIPYEFVTEEHLAIDLIYNPIQTEFLKRCKDKGAWTLNGKTMLEQQAEKAWEIWNS